jgi:hypothetical protein
MADLQRRGNYTPRQVRERRAYQLVVAGSVTGVAGAVGLILAVAGVIGAGFPFVLIIVAVVCGLLFRRMISRP